MKNMIPIQHTQLVQPINGWIGAWTDWDLTELGSEQAKRIGLSFHMAALSVPSLLDGSAWMFLCLTNAIFPVLPEGYLFCMRVQTKTA